MNDKLTVGISEELRQYIEAMVEEVVLKKQPFDKQKKYLHRFCESEFIDYIELEKNLQDFFEVLEEWYSLHTKASSISAQAIGEACFLSRDFRDKLLTFDPTSPKDNKRMKDLTDAPHFPVWAESNHAQAKEQYGYLMADLVPDLINNNEKLETHLYFVKKLAHDSGWDEDETVSALSDLLTMYADFKHMHKGTSFSNGEKKLLIYQAKMAHINETVLYKLF